MKTYGIDDLKIIIRFGEKEHWIEEWIDYKTDGVHLRDETLVNDPLQVMHWKYVCELDDSDSPNPLTAPCLPFPFTASQLAAFMLDGVGAVIPSVYGSWDDGPDQGMLNKLGPLAREPKRAVANAYAAYRAAQNTVGGYPVELEKSADRLATILDYLNLRANKREGVFAQDILPNEFRRHGLPTVKIRQSERNVPPKEPVPEQSPELEQPSIEEVRGERRKRASESVRELTGRCELAKKEFDAAYGIWRKAMVHQLLQPIAYLQNPDVALTRTIENRDALPVRAVPFATGWPQPCAISPDLLVRILATHPKAALSAHKQTCGKPVHLRPSEWNQFGVRMSKLTADLRAQFPDDDQGNADARAVAAWDAQAVGLLPAGVFIWLDEFEDFFHRAFEDRARAEGISTFNQRSLVLREMADARGKTYDCIAPSDEQARAEGAKKLGDGKLNLTPALLGVDVRKMIMEGFEPINVVEQIDHMLNWRVKTTIKKFPGYRKSLASYLKSAHIAGHPLPTAQVVIDAWTTEPPIDITVIKNRTYIAYPGRIAPSDRIVHREGIHFRLETGVGKQADFKAINAAIENLTESTK